MNAITATIYREALHYEKRGVRSFYVDLSGKERVYQTEPFAGEVKRGLKAVGITVSRLKHGWIASWKTVPTHVCLKRIKKLKFSSPFFPCTLSQLRRVTALFKKEGRQRAQYADYILEKVFREARGCNLFKKNPHLVRAPLLRESLHSYPNLRAYLKKDYTSVSLKLKGSVDREWCEGSYPVLIRPYFVSLLKQYDRANDSTLTWVAEQINNLIHDQNELKVKFESFKLGTDPETTLFIESGWHNHTFYILFWQDFIIVGDKSCERESRSCLEVYWNPNAYDIKPDYIEPLLYHNTPTSLFTQGRPYFTDDLGLILIFQKSQKPQSVGHCTFVNLKLIFKSLLMIAELKQSRNSLWESDAWLGAVVSITPSYKKFTAFIRKQAKNTLLHDQQVPGADRRHNNKLRLLAKL